MENEPLVDMSPDAIKERKSKREQEYELAEQVWENMCHQGDEHEKLYWITGFINGLNFGKD